MQSFNHFELLSPGILHQGTKQILLTKSVDSIYLKIEPEKNSKTRLYVIIDDCDIKKKYVIEVNFLHEHSSVEIYGLYQLRNKQMVNIQTMIHHHVSHCLSNQIWKGVLHGESRAVFEGKIIVYPSAIKTHAKLSNKNLLLSDHATVKTKPFLEIYADDVQCSHGATVGCLDESALFYLRSRGISEEIATRLLIRAFVHELFESFSNETLNHYFKSVMHDELAI